MLYEWGTSGKQSDLDKEEKRKMIDSWVSASFSLKIIPRNFYVTGFYKLMWVLRVKKDFP